MRNNLIGLVIVILFMGILTEYTTYVRELQKVPAKGHYTSGKEKNPPTFFSYYGNSYSVSAGTFFI